MRVRRFFSSNKAERVELYVNGQRIEQPACCDACEDPEHPDGKLAIARIAVGPIWASKEFNLCEACLEELEGCARFARTKFGGGR